MILEDSQQPDVKLDYRGETSGKDESPVTP